MFKFINKLFNNKVIITIDAKNIKIKSTSNKEPSTNIRRVIEVFDRQLRIEDVSLIYDDIFIPYSVYLCNSGIIIKDNLYTWKLNKQHFSKKCIEHIWKEAFEMIVLWDNFISLELKICIKYPDGNTEILNIISEKSHYDSLKSDRKYDFKWE